MKIEDQAFSARVELPCKIYCGPDSLLEVSGTAVNIDTGSLRLDLGVLYGAWQPAVGESLRLELVLPVSSARAGARCLSVRARVAQVFEKADGSRSLELRFRKPIFKEADESSAVRAPETGTQYFM